MLSSPYSQILTYIMTHIANVCVVTQADTAIPIHAVVSMYRSLQKSITHLCYHLPTAKYQHSHIPTSPSTKSLTVTPTQTCIVTNTPTRSCAQIHTDTHTAPNTSRAHFISNCEKMLLVFINLQTLCLPISPASLSLFPTLSLSARRQVSASIFSSSVAVKLNGIGLIAENQREG